MARTGFGIGLCASIALAAVIAPEPALGAAWRYVDDRGVVHFTDIPTDARYERISTSSNAVVRRQRQRNKYIPPAIDDYDNLILIAARDHRIEPALVKAVIAAESNFVPTAVSRAGARGLMQLMPQTAASLGVEDSFHPRQNVDGGTRYLRAMLDRFGDVRRALAAYNAGPEAVDQYGGIPPYPETRDYVIRVLHYYRSYYAGFRLPESLRRTQSPMEVRTADRAATSRSAADTAAKAASRGTDPYVAAAAASAAGSGAAGADRGAGVGPGGAAASVAGSLVPAVSAAGSEIAR